MPTVKELKNSIRGYKAKHCPPYSRLRKAGLLSLADKLNLGPAAQAHANQRSRRSSNAGGHTPAQVQRTSRRAQVQRTSPTPRRRITPMFVSQLPPSSQQKKSGAPTMEQIAESRNASNQAKRVARSAMLINRKAKVAGNRDVYPHLSF